MFWVRYIAAAAVSTAAVYFLAPMAARSYRGSHLEDDDGFLVAAPFESDEAALPDDGAGDSAGDKGATPPAARPRRVQRAARPAEVPAERPVTVDGGTPALSISAIPQAPGGIILWGVATIDCPVFKKDGKRLPGKVPGGSLVEATKTTRTSKGEEMALCSIWTGSKWGGEYLVPTADLALYEGTREGFLDAEVSSLMKYFSLNAELRNRKRELEDEAVNANPHSAKVRELDRENKAFAARVRELTKIRDEATGSERSKAADELRRLETVATKNNKELARQVALYKEWKAKHPVKAKDPAEDARCREISAAMASLAPSVEMFGVR